MEHRHISHDTPMEEVMEYRHISHETQMEEVMEHRHISHETQMKEVMEHRHISHETQMEEVIEHRHISHETQMEEVMENRHISGCISRALCDRSLLSPSNGSGRRCTPTDCVPASRVAQNPAKETRHSFAREVTL